VRVHASARAWRADELTLVADVRGDARPDERFVFSAHVQEPGANDNASGVGAQAEMARALAALVRAGRASPRRSVTFLWGDEIKSTRDYLAGDSARARGIRWGMSLDMVGRTPRRPAAPSSSRRCRTPRRCGRAATTGTASGAVAR
jgi:hypothetical protein